ncbi:unnamed protein product [Closterium sp. Yama58-4]|nr:unnamed protein product [Closterium sp. Yama58-4]
MDASESAQELQVQTQEVTMEGETPSRQVRVTVVQAATVMYNTPATLDKEAAQLGSQLVVFPEAFIGGYPRGASFGVLVGSRTDRGRDEFRRYHASAIDVPGPEVSRLTAAAAKFGVFVVMGAIERAGGTLYCSVLFIDPRLGLVGRHRKTVPTALERVIWGCGDGSTAAMVVDAGGVGRVGAAVCWENRMPMARMALYGKGCVLRCAGRIACLWFAWHCMGKEWSSTVRPRQTRGTPGRPAHASSFPFQLPCLLPFNPSPCFIPSPCLPSSPGVELYCAPTADSRDSWQATVQHIALEGGCFILPHMLHLIPAGVELYCAPTADSRDSWQATVQHIALEGGCFVLSANQFCVRSDYPPPPDFVFSATGRLDADEPPPSAVVCRGGSVIVSPLGRVLAGPNYDGQALLTADLDMGDIARAKFDFDVTGHYARPDIFSLRVKEDRGYP